MGGHDEFCEESGVTPAKWVVLGPDDRAAKACAGMTYPLVVKVLPSEAEHKTELGLVKLRVQSPEDVDAHAADFRQRLGKPQMGILVQEMVGDGVEVVLSCLRQTDFGPVISLGMGGVAIELYRDVTYLALAGLRRAGAGRAAQAQAVDLAPGLPRQAGRRRGRPRAARPFASASMFLAAPDVLEFEINPVIVRPKGQGLSAVDALVTTSAR